MSSDEVTTVGLSDMVTTLQVGLSSVQTKNLPVLLGGDTTRTTPWLVAMTFPLMVDCEMTVSPVKEKSTVITAKLSNRHTRQITVNNAKNCNSIF